MGLSNYLANSRISQSGVCTSSTRPASPYEGQMIYETDTNRVLVWDNAAWVMIADTDQPPGLQLVKTQTIGTAVSSVTVTDAFSADYDNYLIKVTGGVASASPAVLNIQLGSTTTGYYYTIVYTSWNTTVQALGSTTSTSYVYAGTGTTNSLYMHCEIMQPYITKNTRFTSTWNNNLDAGYANGALYNTTSYTDLTILASTGTLTGGTIRVYGYRNS